MLYLTGMHNSGQIGSLGISGFFGRRRKVALDLLEELEQHGGAQARDQVLEQFADVRGVFKRTYRNRFEGFDRMIVAALRNAMPTQNVLHVIDAAVSDGSTTISLIEKLEELTLSEFKLTATDADGPLLVLRQRSGDGRRVIVNEAGSIIQIVWPPFVYGNRRGESRHLFPMNRFLRQRAERFAAELVEKWRSDPAAMDVTPLSLMRRELRMKMEHNANLRFQVWNLLQPWQGEPVHCIRAMNILNPGYFTEAQQVQILCHLTGALRPGGLLAAGSNEAAGSVVDGAIWKFRDGQLDEIATTGAGFRCREALASLARST